MQKGLSSSPSILVTGGAGYIGSHICKALFQKGFLPITYDNLSLGNKWAIRWGPFVHGDLFDLPKLTTTCHKYRPLGIIHLAALSNVRKSEQEAGKYYETNISGTLNLLKVARKEKISFFVFSSSCAIYGNPSTIPILETAKKQPISVYGKSKWMAEQILESIAKSEKMHIAYLRYFNAAGADIEGEIGEAHQPETHVLPLLIATALKKQPSFLLHGNTHETKDGTPIRDFIHVTDLALGHVRALQWILDCRRSLTLNLGTGIGHSIQELIHAVERETLSSVPVTLNSSFLSNPPALIADSTKAFDILQWTPKHSSIEEIIKTAVRWHKQ